MYKNASIESMVRKYGGVTFRAEAVDWPLKVYAEYMGSNQDESPLYLFDQSFVEKMEIKVGSNGQYWQPECFGADLFSVLGDARPDSRWLVLGPAKSGSTFHKDPNATRSVLRILKHYVCLLMLIIAPGMLYCRGPNTGSCFQRLKPVCQASLSRVTRARLLALSASLNGSWITMQKQERFRAAWRESAEKEMFCMSLQDGGISW